MSILDENPVEKMSQPIEKMQLIAENKILKDRIHNLIKLHVDIRARGLLRWASLKQSVIEYVDLQSMQIPVDTLNIYNMMCELEGDTSDSIQYVIDNIAKEGMGQDPTNSIEYVALLNKMFAEQPQIDVENAAIVKKVVDIQSKGLTNKK